MDELVLRWVAAFPKDYNWWMWSATTVCYMDSRMATLKRWLHCCFSPPLSASFALSMSKKPVQTSLALHSFQKKTPQSCPKTSPNSFSQSLFLSLFLLLFHPLCFSESSLKDLALKRNTWEFPPKPVPYFLVGKLVGREMNSYEERES